MNHRELPKRIVCPVLTQSDVDIITDICFEDAVDEPFEALVVLGSNIEHEKVASEIVRILNGHGNAALIVTGGVADYNGIDSSIARTAESDALLGIVQRQTSLLGRWVHVDRLSRNTLENLQFVSNVISDRRITSIALVSHSYATGRARMTAAAVLPDVRCSSCFGVDVAIDGNIISKQDWYGSPTSSAVVWAEFNRIAHYGARGDIDMQGKSEAVHAVKRKLRLA